MIVHTLDQVQEDEFNIWHDLEKSYKNHIITTVEKNQEPSGSIAARLHIFPAECNAARYEKNMVKLLKYRKVGWHLLHPRVVMILEYAERIRMFVRCKTYGFIHEIPQKTGGSTFSLEVPQILEIKN